MCLLKTKCSAIPHGGQGSTCQCKQRKLYLSYTRILAVPHIDKSALICCVEYMRNSKKSSPLINNVEKYKFDAGAGVSVAHSRLSMPRNAVQHYLEWRTVNDHPLLNTSVAVHHISVLKSTRANTKSISYSLNESSRPFAWVWPDLPDPDPDQIWPDLARSWPDSDPGSIFARSLPAPDSGRIWLDLARSSPDFIQIQIQVRSCQILARSRFWPDLARSNQILARTLAIHWPGRQVGRQLVDQLILARPWPDQILPWSWPDPVQIQILARSWPDWLVLARSWPDPGFIPYTPILQPTRANTESIRPFFGQILARSKSWPDLARYWPDPGQIQILAKSGEIWGDPS